MRVIRGTAFIIESIINVGDNIRIYKMRDQTALFKIDKCNS